MSGQMVLRGGAAVTPPGHVAPDLSQLFSRRRRAGRSVASDWRRTHETGAARLRAFHDLAPAEESFRDAVLAGLTPTRQKSLPCRFLYDERGSASVRGDLRAAGILSDPHRDADPRRRRGGDRRGGRPACAADRVRQRRQPQGAHCCSMRWMSPAAYVRGRYLARAASSRRRGSGRRLPGRAGGRRSAPITREPLRLPPLPARSERPAPRLLPGLDHRQFRARRCGRFPRAMCAASLAAAAAC